MTSLWQQHHIEDKITAILQEITYETRPDHHFGRPFLSAYQLAIEYARRFPESYQALSYPIGGTGAGVHTSLAQYLARELSRRIRSGDITYIEGAFLSNLHLSDVIFDHQGISIHSSLTHTRFDLSLFRLRSD